MAFFVFGKPLQGFGLLSLCSSPSFTGGYLRKTLTELLCANLSSPSNSSVLLMVVYRKLLRSYSLCNLSSPSNSSVLLMVVYRKLLRSYSLCNLSSPSNSPVLLAVIHGKLLQSYSWCVFTFSLIALIHKRISIFICLKSTFNSKVLIPSKIYPPIYSYP